MPFRVAVRCQIWWIRRELNPQDVGGTLALTQLAPRHGPIVDPSGTAPESGNPMTTIESFFGPIKRFSSDQLGPDEHELLDFMT